jgi:hypothetical protein
VPILSPASRYALSTIHDSTGTFAIHEKLDGKAVDWLEQVTDQQFEGRSV